jgi:hypothetical protein
VLKKTFLRKEDDDLSYLKNNNLQKKNLPAGGVGAKKKKPSSPKFVMKKKVLGDPQYSDCAQNLDNENDLRKRDDRSIDRYEREKATTTTRFD